MLAEQRYMPRQNRTIGFGAAFAINGAVIAGIAFFLAPNFVPAAKDGPLILDPIPLDPVPPPLPEPKPEPKVEPRVAQQPDPFVPTPRVDTDAPPIIDTTEILSPQPAPFTPVERTGPVVEPAPVPTPALPPLVAASTDARYARDFQPDYPAGELRAQRDGQVTVRVLIGTDGRVKAVEQVSATSPAFFEATRRQALAKWRFKPATRGGVPEESWKRMSVRFEIANM